MGVDDVYREFIDHVSEGRKMDPARADQLAQGRVWSGVDAKEIGLVDELGSLEDAVKAAAKRAGVESDYRKVSIETKMDFAEFFMENLLSDINTWFGDSAITKIAASPMAKMWFDGINGLEMFVRFNDPKQVYAYSELPY
jgi:protease IV